MRRRDERGYALFLALVVGSLVLAAMAMAAMALQHRMSLLRQESRVIHLSALADAGLSRALAQLWLDPGYGGGGEALGGGGFEITIVAVDKDHVRVTVHATYHGGRRVVAALVRLCCTTPPCASGCTGPPRVLSWQPVGAGG